MRKLLIGLWLVGAGLYTINTLVLTHTVSRPDKGEPGTQQANRTMGPTLLLPQGRSHSDPGKAPPKALAGDEPDPRLQADRKLLQDKLAENRNELPGQSSPAVPTEKSEPDQLAQAAKQKEPVETGDPSAAPPSDTAASSERRDSAAAIQEDATPPEEDRAAGEQESIPALGEDTQAGAEAGQNDAERVTVSSRGANLRSGPSRSARMLISVPPATQLYVVGRERGWVQVADESGPIGWIYERLLEQSVTEDAGAYVVDESDASSTEPPRESVSVQKYKREGRAGRRIGRGFAGAVRRAVRAF
jgi:hypothetical protein